MKSSSDRSTVFLDSSVLISALISKTGASAALLEQAQKGAFHGAISNYVVGEVRDVLTRKMPHLLPALDEVLQTQTLTLLPPSFTSLSNTSKKNDY